MHLYYDRAGNPVDNMTEWIRQRSDPDGCQVVRTELADAVVVDTTWIGVNLSAEGDRPLIFQTMVHGGPHHGGTWRYPTQEVALAWHGQLVTALKAGRLP